MALDWTVGIAQSVLGTQMAQLCPLFASLSSTRVASHCCRQTGLQITLGRAHSSHNLQGYAAAQRLHTVFTLFQYLGVCLFVFLKKHFIEVLLTYKKLYILNIYNLMSLGVSIYPWNHHCHLGHGHIHHFQVSSRPLFFSALFIYYYNFVIRTLNVRPNPLAKFQGHNTVLLPMGTRLYSRIAKP